jgi:hypothetical protein
MRLRDKGPGGQIPTQRGGAGAAGDKKGVADKKGADEAAEADEAKEAQQARLERVGDALEDDGKKQQRQQFEQAFGQENSTPQAQQQRRVTAHIAFKDKLHLAVDRRASVDPATLQAPENPDAQQFLSSIGVDLRVPEGWRYMGYVEEGAEKRITFNSTGTKEGLEIVLSFWPMPDHYKVEGALKSYEELAEEQKERGDLLDYKTVHLGDAVGLLKTTWVPPSEKMTDSDYERAYLATGDGSGRSYSAFVGFRGKDDGKTDFVVLKVSSKIEDFQAHKGLFDALMDAANVKAG